MAPVANFYIDTILGLRSSTSSTQNSTYTSTYTPTSTSICSSPTSDFGSDYSDGAWPGVASYPCNFSEPKLDLLCYEETRFPIKFSPEKFYEKTLALHNIYMSQLELRPPAWSQKQHQSGNHKNKKYTTEQIAILSKRYEVSHYVTREDMAKLSEKTGLTMLQVKNFFHYNIFRKMTIILNYINLSRYLAVLH